MYSDARAFAGHRWRVPMLGAGVCFITAALMAAVKLIINGGFGKSDIVPFLFWTIPFSVLVGLSREGVGVWLRRYSSVIRYCVAGMLGVLAGIVWTYVVAFFVGPFFGAFSIPVLPCWVVGGISGLLVGINHASGAVRATDLLLIIVVGVIVLAGQGPLRRLVSDSQQVQVIGIRWSPGPEPLSVLGESLTAADVEQLKAIGLSGKVEFASSSLFGEGKYRRILIVITNPINELVTLPQPDANQVVYVQTQQGWKTYPPNAPVLSRSIHLTPDPRDPGRVTRFTVEIANGTRKEGLLATW